MVHNKLTSFGLFLLLLGLSFYVPEINSMFINLSEASPQIKTIIQYAVMVISFGFLYAVVVDNDS